jgi:tetratricopeptide (TPR) repeat protein
MWRSWLGRANYVVLVAPRSDFIPWSPGLLAWFNNTFRLVYSQPGTYVYANSSLPFSPSSDATANQLVTQGLAAEQGGNLNQAFSDYQAAATKDPNNKYAHYDLGYIYQQRNDTQDATTEYDKVLQLDPTFTRAIYNLAVLEAPTDPSGAIALYKQDLQLDSTNASANFNLGVLLVKEGQVPQGQSYIQIALRLNPALASDLPPGVTP